MGNRESIIVREKNTGRETSWRERIDSTIVKAHPNVILASYVLLPGVRRELHAGREGPEFRDPGPYSYSSQDYSTQEPG